MSNNPSLSTNQKADHINGATKKFFGPSIKKDALRWACNLVYIGAGLMYNWATSAVLRQIPNMSRFPSNVASMIVLFFLLVCSNVAFPKFTDKLVLFIDPYSSFVLRSMSIMFVPAVIQIVNQPPTTGGEVGRMMCVFIVSYVIGFLTCTVIVRLLSILILTPSALKHDEQQHLNHDPATTTSEKTATFGNRTLDQEQVQIGVPDIAHLDSLQSIATLVDDAGMRPSESSDTLCELLNSTGTRNHGPLRAIAIWCMENSLFDDVALIIIFSLCALVYMPMPEDHPAMPFLRLFMYFTMTIVLYSAACRLPAKARLVLHPIIVCSLFTMAGIAYFESVKGFDIKHGVRLYKSGITFISLVEQTNVGWPGGGDLFGAAMDVAIISLAFNAYKSRPGSLRQWIIIVFSIALMVILIMLVTPLFAHGIGCMPDNSLVWASRSATTAIGIVISNVLGSNGSIVTCIIVFTGIMGPLFGPYLLKLARVRDDDYMTMGITMGCCSHGIGTAYLISKNPIASGVASISFAVFGTIAVVFASIPVFSSTIRFLSGY